MVIVNGQAERAIRAYAKAQLTLNLEARPVPMRISRADNAAQKRLRASFLREEVRKSLMERSQKMLNLAIDALIRAKPGRDAIIVEEVVRIYGLIGTYGKEGERCNLHLREMPCREQVEEAGKIFLGFSRAHSRRYGNQKFYIVTAEEREANQAFQLHNNFNLLQSLHILLQDREYDTFLELLNLIRKKCIEEAKAPRKRADFSAQTYEMQVFQLLSMDGTIAKVEELASLGSQ